MSFPDAAPALHHASLVDAALRELLHRLDDAAEAVRHLPPTPEMSGLLHDTATITVAGGITAAAASADAWAGRAVRQLQALGSARREDAAVSSALEGAQP